MQQIVKGDKHVTYIVMSTWHYADPQMLLWQTQRIVCFLHSLQMTGQPRMIKQDPTYQRKTLLWILQQKQDNIQPVLAGSTPLSCGHPSCKLIMKMIIDKLSFWAGLQVKLCFLYSKLLCNQ